MDTFTSKDTARLTRSPQFEPDILSSHQFFKVFTPRSHTRPEHMLMFAVLSDAIECFQTHVQDNTPTGRRLFAQAEAWIACRRSSWPYSFEHICEALSLDANYVRMGLMRWRENTESTNSYRWKRLRDPLRYQHRVRRPARA
jgi:hypothetical protein